MSQSQYYHKIYNVELKSIKKYVTLVPFADIHRDTKNCAVNAWLRFCEKERKLLDEGANRIYIGIGDYNDFMSDSERDAYNICKKHESTKQTIEDLAKQKCDDLLGEISFMRNRLIGLIEGNHYFVLSNGTTSTQYMCDKLNCFYLGGVATIRLNIDCGNKQVFAVDILASHYGTGGTLMGSALNSLERMMKVASMDIYVQGHTHQRVAHKCAKPLFLNNRGTLKAREMVMCNPGSYLLGYVDGEESYPVKKLMRPVSVGQVYIDLVPKRIENNEELDRYIHYRVVQE